MIDDSHSLKFLRATAFMVAIGCLASCAGSTEGGDDTGHGGTEGGGGSAGEGASEAGGGGAGEVGGSAGISAGGSGSGGSMNAGGLGGDATGGAMATGGAAGSGDNAAGGIGGAAGAKMPVGYRANVLADGPIGYFRLGDTGTKIARDDSPGMNHGQYVNGVTLGQASALAHDADTAAKFDAIDDHVDLGTGFDFPGLAPFSVELWMAFGSKSLSSGSYVVSKMKNSAGWGGYEIFLAIGEFKGLRFCRLVEGIWDCLTVPYPSQNTYAHVVSTFDGTTMKLYVNGKLAGSKPSTLFLKANDAPLWLGSKSIVDAFRYQGLMDEVAFYAFALSAERVKAHFDAASSN